MKIIQEREKTFKKEVKVFWEEVQNKLNFSYSELNELYKENRKYNLTLREFSSDNQNSNSNYNQLTNNINNFKNFNEKISEYNNNQKVNPSVSSLEYNNPQMMGSIKSKVRI